MDGEMCLEQAEKLRIVREHMSDLDSYMGWPGLLRPFSLLRLSFVFQTS